MQDIRRSRRYERDIVANTIFQNMYVGIDYKPSEFMKTKKTS